MEKYNIVYKGKPYPAVDMVLFEGTPDEMNTTVATIDLSDEIVADIDIGVGVDEANRLDETICYYVQPSEIDLPYRELVQLVESSYD